MASLRYSAAEESEDTLNASQSFTVREVRTDDGARDQETQNNESFV